jgi:hypothetical protein
MVLYMEGFYKWQCAYSSKFVMAGAVAPNGDTMSWPMNMRC